MELSVRKPPYIIPSYSLTGDLLSFLRCGLQYRYGGLGQLPATRPAQLWFGQFIHGVLEEAYRRYRRRRDETGIGLVVAGDELEDVLELIHRRLAANGLRARNANLEAVGRERAIAAVTELGPELFPIIDEAEIPLNGTRRLPFDRWPATLPRRESDRYEMAGIVDVITEIQLDDPALANNRVVHAIVSALAAPFPSEFEVIVDYKGMRRPPSEVRRGQPDYWSIYEWQVQTYARLRSVQAHARPVLAGALIFLNELHPTWSDLDALRREATAGHTDVAPRMGTEDARLLAAKRQRGAEPPALSFEFRLERALRVIPVSTSSQDSAAAHFDDVVFEIEVSRAKERRSPHILAEWPTNASDDATCAACDWRTICPEHPTAVAALPAEEA
jgi:hypothetical protein